MPALTIDPSPSASLSPHDRDALVALCSAAYAVVAGRPGGDRLRLATGRGVVAGGQTVRGGSRATPVVVFGA
jgi:hypothetical protein